jgi:CheY-like chemotaxis protein
MTHPPEAEAHRHVLVVDDDSDIRETLVALFEGEGYSASGAVDGAEGLAQARERPPDAIVLDLAMPGLDGRRFLEAQRAEPALASVPVVVISASDFAMEGVHLFLSKPFDFNTLLTNVARCLARA